MSGSPATLEELASQKIGVVRDDLRCEEGKFLWVYKRAGQPVRRKLLETTYRRLTALSSCLAEHRADLPPATAVEVRAALDMIEEDPRKRDAWGVVDALGAVLPLVSRDALLYESLIGERVRAPDRGLHWDELFGPSELKTLLADYDREQGAFKSSGNRALAREHLHQLRLERNDVGRHSRARARTRARYLFHLGTILLPLGLLLAFTPWFLEAVGGISMGLPLPTMLLAFAAGALGSTISGTLRIRQVERISEFEGVGSGLVAQVALGAALAVVVLLFLNAGLVSIGGQDSPERWIAIGFAAGFSEPFAIGILEQVASAPNGADERR